MTKTVGSSHCWFEEIPTPIVWDILVRLPTKACLICKGVCKEWNTIIKDPEFADLRASSGCYSTLLLSAEERNFLLVDLDKSSKVDEINGNLIVKDDAKISFKPKFMVKFNRLLLVNECNGVVCLKEYSKWGCYIVCNLLTGEYVSVKQIRKPWFETVMLFGLGCCPVTRQFKVVRLLQRWGKSSCKTEIQTIGSNEWRNVDNDKLFSCYGLTGTPVFLNGSVHRLCAYTYICSFNFENEKFLRISLPDHEGNVVYGHQLSIFDSCLCFSCSVEVGCSNQFNIWVMKEYGMKDSWVKQFVLKKACWNEPVLWQMNTEEILTAYCKIMGRLAAYDIKSDTVFLRRIGV